MTEPPPEPPVWWDSLHRHYGWTCPVCRCSGVNCMSVDAAKHGLAAHRQTCANAASSPEVDRG